MLRFCTLLFILGLLAPPVAPAQTLRVSDNGRYLVRPDGTPFFWLGDTAWELFHRFTREEADFYFKKRAEQGFNVIQAVVLAELDGLTEPTPEGYLPLHDNDPTRPRADYLAKVDALIDGAARHNLYIGLLPTWGDKVNGDRAPAIFTPANARTYGRLLAERYRNRPNLIWILGGDRFVDTPERLAIWRAMAAGVQEGLGGADRGLLTFHPRGGRSSSPEFHQDDWLDLNLWQTGHCRDAYEHEAIRGDYARTPAKPVINGEPIYEAHPVCFNVEDMGHSNAHDVRRAAYLSVFAGACGHTYGCHSVWQAYTPARRPINAPLQPWNESLELPGASQLRHLRALIESRPVLARVPNQALLPDAPHPAELIQATQGTDYLFVYSGLGRPFRLNLGTLPGARVRGYWYNPRTGESQDAGTFDNRGQQTFKPPRVQRDGLDWVLVLDDASRSYPAPGTRPYAAP